MPGKATNHLLEGHGKVAARATGNPCARPVSSVHTGSSDQQDPRTPLELQEDSDHLLPALTPDFSVSVGLNTD